MVASRSISVTRFMAAPASRIFDLLADPRQHALFDGSGTVTSVKHAPKRLALGSTFSMHMKLGLGYVTRNRVVEFEEDKRIAWHHFALFVWRYQLETVDEGTNVTESFTFDKPWNFVIEMMKFPERNQRAIEATLARLEQIVTA